MFVQNKSGTLPEAIALFTEVTYCSSDTVRSSNSMVTLGYISLKPLRRASIYFFSASRLLGTIMRRVSVMFLSKYRLTSYSRGTSLFKR